MTRYCLVTGQPGALLLLVFQLFDVVKHIVHGTGKRSHGATFNAGSRSIPRRIDETPALLKFPKIMGVKVRPHFPTTGEQLWWSGLGRVAIGKKHNCFYFVEVK